MKPELINQLDYFTTVRIPRFITENIQRCALSHLKLKDMGQLRDRMEGQLYYSKLKNDITAEYAFEYHLGLRPFDWNKRLIKDYKRKIYNFKDQVLRLVIFDEDSFPQLKPNKNDVYIFIYLGIENRALISGLANYSQIYKSSIKRDHEIHEMCNFTHLSQFANFDELLESITANS